MSLIEYGWDEHFGNAYDEIGDKELIPARITADYGQAVRTVTQDGEILVNRHIHEERSFGVGDFVCLRYDPGNRVYTIGEILPRKTKFSRTAAGAVLKEQIVAANIDTVFVMQSLNNDFNMRRLERYIIAAWESGAVPVIILTKSDLCDDAEGKLSEVFSVAAGVATHAVSAVTGEGMDDLRQYFLSGKTIAFLGSSGVGKSTLVNVLMGKEIFKTQEVLRDDDRGRHTTSHRQLVLIPGGGCRDGHPGNAHDESLGSRNGHEQFVRRHRGDCANVPLQRLSA